MELKRENRKVCVPSACEKRKGEKCVSGGAPGPKGCASPLLISSFGLEPSSSRVIAMGGKSGGLRLKARLSFS